MNRNFTKKHCLLLLCFVWLCLLFLFIFIAPDGFLGKLHAIGYAFCHQFPVRSPHINDQVVFCFRCSGLFFGFFDAALISAVFRYSTKKWSVLSFAFSALAFLFYFVDIINSDSFLKPIILSFMTLESSEATRFLSGCFVGIALYILLSPVFFRLIDDCRTQSVSIFFLLILSMSMSFIESYFLVKRDIFFTKFSNLILALTAYIFLSWLYFLIISLLQNLRKQANIHLKINAVLAAILGILQILSIDILRFSITGFWYWPAS